LDIFKLKDLQDNNPSWSMLRKEHAAYILVFLIDSFKTKHRTEIPTDQLVADLVAFQDHLKEREIEALKGSAEAILSSWAGDKEQILWRSHDAENDHYVFTLRASTEEVIQFVVGLLERSAPVAAETNLKRIFTMLEDIVLMGHGDVESHIERLEEKRDAIQRDIDRIKNDGVLEKNPYRIREEFRTLETIIRSLAGDFRRVEESFREVAKDIQVASVGERTNRGDVLEWILDHDEQLRDSEQGKSFFAFLELLNRPDELVKLDERRDALREIPELADFDLTEVMNFERRLLQEAMRVNKTVQRLSRQLRRVLDDKANAERQKMLQQIQKILSAFANEHFVVDDPIEFMPVSGLPQFRTLDDFSPYRPPAKLQQQDTNVFKADERMSTEAFSDFASMERIDYDEMVSAIHRTFAVLNKDTLTIPEVVSKRPLKHGLIELAGYLQIAHDKSCPIDQRIQESIKVPGQGSETMKLTYPAVRYRKVDFETKESTE